MLKVCSVHRHAYDKAFGKCDDRFLVTDTRDQHEGTFERTSRESTPEEFYGEDADFAFYKKRVKEGLKKEDAEGRLKEVSVKFGLTENYRASIKVDWPKYTGGSNKEHIERMVSFLGQTFINTLLVSNDGCWLIVTQVEVYCKNKSLDDCSNNSPISKSKKSINVVVEKKGESPSWLEMKIYVGNYEMLVTGGVFGFVQDPLNQFNCFLGSSTSRVLYDENYWLAYFPAVAESPVKCVRLLRNFQRRDSRNLWSFISPTFAASGFTTASPFGVAGNVFESIASRLVETGSRGRISLEVVNRCRMMLIDAQIWKMIGLEDRPANNNDILQNLTSSKLSIVKKTIIRKILQFQEGELEHDLIEMYNRILYPHLRRNNDKAIIIFKSVNSKL